MLTGEFRHALRSLRRAPALAAISVVIIALGVGAGTALFSVVKAVLLNPLPYPSPAQLAWVEARNDSGTPTRCSLPDFDDWHSRNHSFVALAAYGDGPFVAGGGTAPERTFGAAVTEDFFDVLGVRPVLGRTFIPEDHRAGSALSVVVLGYGIWQRAYGGDPKIIGRKISVLGFPATVVGVMPPGFSFPARSEMWASARALDEGDSRTAHNFWAIGRLRPGTTAQASSHEISDIEKRLKQQYPGSFQSADAAVIPLATHLVGSVRTPLLILFGAVGLLLLIVCVNVASLLLVRVMSRSRELAVRSAMGAERRHLFRHLLMESLVLASAGGVTGFVIALWSMDLLRILLPSTVPRAEDVRIDGGVAVFAFALTMLAGALFGTMPAWRATRFSLSDALKAGSRGQTATRRSQKLQGALVISEVALSLLLVAGAGLLIQSFLRLRAVDPGFRAAGALSAELSFPVSAAERDQLTGQYDNLLERVRSLPGVEAAGTIKTLPLDPIQGSGHFFIENRRETGAPEAGYLIISPGLMEAIKIPMVGGRRFDTRDMEGSRGTAIVSAKMAARYWPGRNPIGEHIWFDSFDPKENWLTIVGVAGDVRQYGLTEPAPAQAYVCYSHVRMKGQLGTGNLIMRAALDPASLIPAVRRIVREVNPEAAVSFRTMDDVLDQAMSRQRFQMQVLASFAFLALALAAVGLYGALSYSVTSNRAMIGVRMALGARPWQVFQMIAGRALRLTAGGALIGLTGCIGARRLLAAVVFGVGPSDPSVLIAASVVMMGTALAACWFPARRAMRVDPIVALREE